MVDTGTRPADVVVGVTSYNNAASVGDVIRHVRASLEGPLAAVSSVVVLTDAGSADHTIEQARVAMAEARPLTVIPCPPTVSSPTTIPFHGMPGRPEAVRAVLRVAQEAGAKGCVILDAGVTSMTAEWTSRLLAPVLTGEADYASAFYQRRAAEGAITKSIVYPVFRALYGSRLPQPAAAEFGCSAALLQYYLDQALWTGDEAQVGIDLWLASAAVAGGFRVCEVPLGLRLHGPRVGAPDLSTALSQVVGALFLDLEARADWWQRVRGSEALPVFGEAAPQTQPPQKTDRDHLLESFRLGYRALRDVWAWILPPKTILQLKRLADAPPERFRIDDETWARIVYDFALGYRLRAMPRDHLLGSLTPLYLGWLASFLFETDGMDAAAADQRLDRMCVAFETEKPYLISRWRWPERFRS